MPVIKGHGMSYGNAKAGTAWGAASPQYDDTEWRLLNLPHDWAVEQIFDPAENLSQGYRKRGVAWYRRSFKVSPQNRGKHIELQFDGIATNAVVWFNGNIVHRNWSGYTSFYIDITPFIKYGDELNTISVRVDAVPQEGWWYEGAGIYRHSWLVYQQATHIVTDGVYANPVKKNKNSWTIPIEVTLENSGNEIADVEVESILYDKKGTVITQNKTDATINPLEKEISKFSLSLENPDLWQIEDPILYTVKTIVKQNGKNIDEVLTNCGFRTIKFTAENGFYLNDKNIKMKGTCNHQDHAGVGVAVPESIWEFRIKKLKEMGSNAYRCAHNPPAKEFLDACDRMGLLVMDENRTFNTSPEYQHQLEWLIRRDRNHPSIILWSVFNEEPMQSTEVGYEMVRRMSAIVKSLDSTRPVTAAMNGGQFTALNVSNAVDVVGFNYNGWSFDDFHKARPNIPITSSEDVSGLMQRDVYVTDKRKHTVASYDEEKPEWGSTHRAAWKQIDQRPFLAGCFVWTGFDYRGEPTPYDWPTAGSNFGIMDACGFPKNAFYLHQAQWITEMPILELAPHWNWPKDSIGKNIKVMAFSNADKVKLILNGKVIGEQAVDKYEMNTWMVPYQPGKLEAYSYIGSKEISHFIVETTGEPASVKLTADRNAIKADGLDAVPVTVEILDKKGRLVRTDNSKIHFEIKGDAEIIGLGNGDPNSHEPEKGDAHSVYNGLGQVILQSKANGKGAVILKAAANGLKSASAVLDLLDTRQRDMVPVVKQAYLLQYGWRVSPFYSIKPDPNMAVSDNDMNTWSQMWEIQLQEFKDRFAIYRYSFRPYAEQRKKGGKLLIREVIGKIEVWLDNKLVATKRTFEKGDIELLIDASENERKISLLIEAEKGSKAGLSATVQVLSSE